MWYTSMRDQRKECTKLCGNRESTEEKKKHKLSVKVKPGKTAEVSA